eukprot:scaffold25717_cov65-Phaeocystis_antarctica.AAC.2
MPNPRWHPTGRSVQGPSTAATARPSWPCASGGGVGTPQSSGPVLLPAERTTSEPLSTARGAWSCASSQRLTGPAVAHSPYRCDAAARLRCGAVAAACHSRQTSAPWQKSWVGSSQESTASRPSSVSVVASNVAGSSVVGSGDVGSGVTSSSSLRIAVAAAAATSRAAASSAPRRVAAASHGIGSMFSRCAGEKSSPLHRKAVTKAVCTASVSNTADSRSEATGSPFPRLGKPCHHSPHATGGTRARFRLSAPPTIAPDRSSHR